MLLIFLEVNGLKCYECSTIDNDNACNDVLAIGNGTECQHYQDICIKVVTLLELPHSGPRNRTAEKELASE